MGMLARSGMSAQRRAGLLDTVCGFTHFQSQAATLRLLALRSLLGSPYITATPADWAPGAPQAAAAAAAAQQAGELLPARLLHVLHALAGSSWASWLQGGWAC